MQNSTLPSPPLVPLPARDNTRSRWIGKYVRFHSRHFKPLHPNHPDKDRILANRAKWISQGKGQILNVGLRSWFLIRWEDGTVENQNKIDLEVFEEAE